MKLVRDRIPELAGLTAAEVECARARKARIHGAYARRLIWQPTTTPLADRDRR